METIRNTIEKLGLETASVNNMIRILLVAVTSYLVARVILKLAFRTLDAMPVEKTLIKFGKSTLRILVYFIVILIIVDQLGVKTSSLVALVSVFSAAFALAAQNALSNLCGGILLLFTKPFLVGDYVSAGGVEGTILEIGLLNTQINTADNKRITVPNGTISAETIINYSTEGMRRVDINVTASYDAPVELVKKTLQEAVDITADVRNEPMPPFIHVFQYGESSIEYVVRVWTSTADYWNVYFELMENIKVCFDRRGVEMTYNHLNVHMMPQ